MEILSISVGGSAAAKDKKERKIEKIKFSALTNADASVANHPAVEVSTTPSISNILALQDVGVKAVDVGEEKKQKALKVLSTLQDYKKAILTNSDSNKVLNNLQDSVNDFDGVSGDEAFQELKMRAEIEIAKKEM